MLWWSLRTKGWSCPASLGETTKSGRLWPKTMSAPENVSAIGRDLQTIAVSKKRFWQRSSKFQTKWRSGLPSCQLPWPFLSSWLGGRQSKTCTQFRWRSKSDLVSIRKQPTNQQFLNGSFNQPTITNQPTNQFNHLVPIIHGEFWMPAKKNTKQL